MHLLQLWWQRSVRCTSTNNERAAGFRPSASSAAILQQYSIVWWRALSVLNAARHAHGRGLCHHRGALVGLVLGRHVVQLPCLGAARHLLEQRAVGGGRPARHAHPRVTLHVRRGAVVHRARLHGVEPVRALHLGEECALVPLPHVRVRDGGRRLVGHLRHVVEREAALVGLVQERVLQLRHHRVVAARSADLRQQLRPAAGVKHHVFYLGCACIVHFSLVHVLERHTVLNFLQHLYVCPRSGRCECLQLETRLNVRCTPIVLLWRMHQWLVVQNLVQQFSMFWC
mmetsp:Transcript_25383/g.64469  ORF Transcript_25383/g.64469 Transcript_25383/m.64469 type:complete len:285 (+) Transcript_25383:275-1129(+)